MKQVFKVVVLVGALLGLGLGGQTNAATDTKKTQPVAKKSDSKASAGATKTARTVPPPAGKPVATKAPKKSASVAGQAGQHRPCQLEEVNAQGQHG
jgi:hypothetical protein